MTLLSKRALLDKLTEGKNRLNYRQIGLWIKKQFVLRGLASFALFAVLLPIGLTPASVSEASPVLSEPVVLKLDTTSDSLLVSDRKMSQIVPGESATDKAAREKAEAEKAAQAKAAAEKAAQAASASRNTVSRERRVYADPSNFDEIYNRAGAAYGVSPIILKAVHTVETGRSGSTAVTSYAGAQGPMQFLPSTWRRYGVDGNGDGIKDINNVEDAIFGAAAYLKACGYPNVQKALWGYNPSTSYYNKVMGVARSLGF